MASCIVFVLCSGITFATAGCFAGTEVVEPHTVVYTSHIPQKRVVYRTHHYNYLHSYHNHPHPRRYHRVVRNYRSRVRYHNNYRHAHPHPNRYRHNVRHHRPVLKKRVIRRKYDKRGNLRRRTIRRNYY